MPPAIVVVLAADPLREEGVAYADRLRGAGVDVELIEFDNPAYGAEQPRPYFADP